MRTTTPLFRFDAGWLYLVSGVAICMSGVLIPARANVRQLEDQLAAIRQLDTRTVAQLEGYGQFQDALDREDRGLIRRLAATQLNLMPEGDVPLLIDRSASARYADWIDASIAASFAPAAAPARSAASLLERLATGAWRLWFLGAGVLCVFVGMLMSPELDAKVVMRATDKDDIEDAIEGADEDACDDALEDESHVNLVPANETPADAGIATIPRAGLVARLKDPRPGCSPIAIAAGAAAVEADVPDQAAAGEVVVDDAPSIPDAGEPAAVEIEFAKDLFSMLPSESATPSDDASAEVEAMLPAPAPDCVSVEGGPKTESDRGIDLHDDGATSPDEAAPYCDVEPGSSAERSGEVARHDAAGGGGEDDEQDEYEYVDVDEDGEGVGDGADAEDGGEDDEYEYEYVYEDVEEDDPEDDEDGEVMAEDVAEGAEDDEEGEDVEDLGEYDEDEDDVDDDEDDEEEYDDEDDDEDDDEEYEDDGEELAAAADGDVGDETDDGDAGDDADGDEGDDDDTDDDDEYEYEYVYEYVDVDDDDEGEEPEEDAERASA
jgi:hypothetical protein